MLKRFIVSVILLLILLPLSTAFADSAPRNQAVIDQALRYRLSDAGEHERIEVIIQFHGRVEERDLAFLRVHGFEIFRTFDVMPVVYAEGEKREIERLSGYERTGWIEYNAPMQYYMNMTKYVIHARDVWLSQIRDKNDVSPPINGSGVTVVVLDSGIDGTHPDLDYNPVDIENGDKPEPGQKVIANVKKDQDWTGNDPELKGKNTDTSSGHGTHCAGTVAGNGQASAGRIVGIAPGAWLIGYSMGEGFATIDEYSGMVWVYEQSRPGNNPANIRVVTNSWGPGFPFDSLDPNDATAQIINMLVHENNVAVVFAAGNDGRGHHEGDSDTVNIFAKVPAVIGVAATWRNGKGLADFSSRGDKDKVETWPDIAAPGVKIWSAAARTTLIGIISGLQDLTRDENDPYYFAISGTSMATPHVAGLVALLWEACPSMTMSDTHEDYECELPLVIEDNSGNFEGGPYTFTDTRIHESELILKLTADYLPAGENNGVPSGNGSTRTGLGKRIFDLAQGYGLVNAKKAVALALKLQHLRDPDGDGVVDNPEKTVWDAYNKSYEKMIKQKRYSKKTDSISHSWSGEFVDIDKSLAEESSIYDEYIPMTNQKHSVYISEDTEELIITFRYIPLHIRYEGITDIPEGSWGYLALTIDLDEDGEYDFPATHPITPDFSVITEPNKEQKNTLIIDFTWDPFLGKKGRNWTFDIFGYAFSITSISKGARNEYRVNMMFRLDAEEEPKIPYDDFWFEEPSSQYYEGKVYLNQNWYVLQGKSDSDDELELSGEVVVSMILILVLGLTGSWLYLKKKFGLFHYQGLRPGEPGDDTDHTRNPTDQ